MQLNEQMIRDALSSEIAEAGKRKHSGQITLTVDLNQGSIARAVINRGRAISPPPLTASKREAVTRMG